jgi:hypothetical protein
VHDSARTLASYLGRIGSAEFAIENGDGARGIAVGVASDFPELQLAEELKDASPAGQEKYLLRSHASGVYVVGATDLAVRHATWDLLYRLGHRQFFPGETWEVVPKLDTITISVDTVQKPAYVTRMIWANYGTWDYNVEPNKLWQARNRAPGGFVLKTGHAYDAIINKNKAEFEKHPEYRGLVKGERKRTKLCISNPGLRQLVVDYAIRQLEENPQNDSVSVDPSDGGGWCECEPCAAIGTPSDRALLLANTVAETVEQKFPDKYVGMYAYNFHAAPPTKVTAHPKVIVCVATAFLRGQTVEGLIEGWRAKGIKQFGIREYFSINTWDRDLPGRARAGALD